MAASVSRSVLGPLRHPTHRRPDASVPGLRMATTPRAPAIRLFPVFTWMSTSNAQWSEGEKTRSAPPDRDHDGSHREGASSDRLILTSALLAQPLPAKCRSREWPVRRPCDVTQVNRAELQDMLDVVIRSSSPPSRSRPERLTRQWALLDTRGCDPGDYLIRGWTDSDGVSRPVENPPQFRHGGAIGLFTLQAGCVSVGPGPVGVDDGAGLLLFGFSGMVAIPLPAVAGNVLEANWLLVLSSEAGAFEDSEIDRLLLLVWALLDEEQRGGTAGRLTASVPAAPLAAWHVHDQPAAGRWVVRFRTKTLRVARGRAALAVDALFAHEMSTPPFVTYQDMVQGSGVRSTDAIGDGRAMQRSGRWCGALIHQGVRDEMELIVSSGKTPMPGPRRQDAPRVMSVQAGRIAPLGPNGVPSGFVKSAVVDAVPVGHLGLEGDEQADLTVHGGPDKAVYFYPAEHYLDWLRDVPRHERALIAGAFGENLTTSGLTEDSVSIGEVLRIGSTELQVTQPRQPCFKLGLRFGDNTLGRIMMQSGRTGWYVRVLTPEPCGPVTRLRFSRGQIPLGRSLASTSSS